nr:MAG TPA: hypothetical protein [Caudoviricetes sp.]
MNKALALPLSYTSILREKTSRTPVSLALPLFAFISLFNFYTEPKAPRASLA